MEAYQLKTLDDLLASPDERIELIDGELVRRPMARSEHGIVQKRASVELGPFDQKSGPGGWSIITQVSVNLDGDNYRVVKTISDQSATRIPPFDSIELDLAYILGD